MPCVVQSPLSHTITNPHDILFNLNWNLNLHLILAFKRLHQYLKFTSDASYEFVTVEEMEFLHSQIALGWASPPPPSDSVGSEPLPKCGVWSLGKWVRGRSLQRTGPVRGSLTPRGSLDVALKKTILNKQFRYVCYGRTRKEPFGNKSCICTLYSKYH